MSENTFVWTQEWQNAEWERQTQERVFILPDGADCFCDEPDGYGHSYQDEYGDCDVCTNTIRCSRCNGDYGSIEAAKKACEKCNLCEKIPFKTSNLIK